VILLEALQRAASIGWVYDTIQVLAGASITRRRFKEYLKDCYGVILDIGGGTGTLSYFLPARCRYVCLDNEMPKLRRCARKIASPILGDATKMPIESGSVDFATCVSVTHHLTPEQLDSLLRETARVLKHNGCLILMDAVLKPSRLPGRILWYLDRGAYPKRSVTLRAAIERHFIVDRWDRLAIYHEYAIGVCRKGKGNSSQTGNFPRTN
jgi:ubiquinone/menaquinone biosynthesis C-methylase UbiE